MAKHDDNAWSRLSAMLPSTPQGNPKELGRLQSNLLGTEFQIFLPRKKPIACRDDSYVLATSTCLEEPVASNAREERDRSLGEASNSRPSRRRLRRRESWPMFGLTSRTNRRAIAHADPSSTTTTPHACAPEYAQNSVLPLAEIENGVITYTANLLGNRPRIMDVCVPRLPTTNGGSTINDGSFEDDGYLACCDWEKYCRRIQLEGPGQPLADGNLMLSKFKHLQERISTRGSNNTNLEPTSQADPAEEDEDFGLLALQNRPPWWNTELGAFVLNFGGRVSVASVKNFQLCDRNDQEYVMLQFGRIQGRHSFTMDFQWPLTAVQAFAIAISSLQSKISLG